jgi:hypothetical protein
MKYDWSSTCIAPAYGEERIVVFKLFVYFEILHRKILMVPQIFFSLATLKNIVAKKVS